MTNEILITIIIAIITVGLTLWGIKLQFYSKPKEEILHLKTQFRATQSLSLQLQKELGELINNYNCRDSYIFQGIKYGTYYDELVSSFQVNLSDELFNTLDFDSLPKGILISMTKSLEQQAENLTAILIETKLHLKQLSD